MVAADFNNDGRLDIHADNIYLNTTTGSVITFSPISPPATTMRSYGMGMGDFDNDGRIDLF